MPDTIHTNTPEVITIVTRESRLAMWQAHHIRDRLSALYPNMTVKIIGTTTRGDQILDQSLSKIGGKGLFVKELEVALHNGSADIAVHSLKDVPMNLPDGFALACVTARENAQDAFISNQYASLEDLPAGAVVGTSSLRREAMLKKRYPHLKVHSLRGNLDTRLRKLDEGQYDAIILAAAGLKRLELQSRIRQLLPAETSLPANGQGALGIECRPNDAELLALLAPLAHPATALCVRAERAMNRALQGGCQVPIGAYAELHGDDVWLRGLVGSPDGQQILRAERQGPAATAEQLGQSVAEQLLAMGADKILREVYSA